MKKFLIAIFIVFFMFSLILMPKETSQGFLEGVKIWYFNLLPSLLPFFIFTKLFETLGVTDKISKIFKKPFHFLFGGSEFGSYVFIMSLLSGYPVSQKIILDFYESGKISENEASHMSVFTSNSGLLFVVGTTGIVIFDSMAIGLAIFCCHVLASVAIGMTQNIFKKAKRVSAEKKMSGLSLRQSEPLSANKIESFSNTFQNVHSKITKMTSTTCQQEPLGAHATCKQESYLKQSSAHATCKQESCLKQSTAFATCQQKSCLKQSSAHATHNQESCLKQSSNPLTTHHSQPATRKTLEPLSNQNQDLISSAVSSIFLVGTYVALFSMVSSLLGHLGFFSIFNGNLFLTGVFQGILEMTKGILTLSTHPSTRFAVVVTGGLISFSGISILMQSLTFLGKCHVGKTKYILAKLIQGMLTMAFLSLLFVLYPNIC